MKRLTGPSPGAFALGMWALVAVLGTWMVVARPEHAGNDWWLGRFRTPEVAADNRIGQKFKMNAPDLAAVELHAEAVRPVGGRIRVELRDLDIGPGEVIRAVDVDAAAVVRTDRYRFVFAPVHDSQNRYFQVDLTAPEGSTGVVLLATSGDRFRDGALVVNGDEAGADLVFQTDTTARSVLGRLLDRAGFLGSSGPIVLGAMLVGWLGLGYLLRCAANSQGPGVGPQR